MENKLLGQVEIEINSKKYTLKPEFLGLAEMESRAGCTMPMLANKILSGSAGLRDVVSILYGGLIGQYGDGACPFTFNDLGNEILTSGFSNYLEACGKIVGAGYSGKPIDEIYGVKSEENKEREEDGLIKKDKE